MTQQAQLIAVSQPNNSSSFRELLLTPIGLCGHAWTWMKAVQGGTVASMALAIALRILAAPVFVAAMLVSTGLAVIGALMSSTRSLLVDNPRGNQELLRRDIPDRNVAAEVKGVLERQGCACDVEVTSSPQFCSSDRDYAQYVSRTITLTSEGCVTNRIYQVVKNRFYHVPAVSLDDLHLSPDYTLIPQQAVIDQVNRALVEDGRVCLELAFDLAICRTTVG